MGLKLRLDNKYFKGNNVSIKKLLATSSVFYFVLILFGCNSGINQNNMNKSVTSSLHEASNNKINSNGMPNSFMVSGKLRGLDVNLSIQDGNTLTRIFSNGESEDCQMRLPGDGFYTGAYSSKYAMFGLLSENGYMLVIESDSQGSSTPNVFDKHLPSGRMLSVENYAAPTFLVAVGNRGLAEIIYNREYTNIYYNQIESGINFIDIAYDTRLNRWLALGRRESDESENIFSVVYSAQDWRRDWSLIDRFPFQATSILVDSGSGNIALFAAQSGTSGYTKVAVIDSNNNVNIITTPTTQNIVGMDSGNGVLIGVADGGDLIRSLDGGLTWSLKPADSNDTVSFKSIVFSQGIFLMRGLDRSGYYVTLTTEYGDVVTSTRIPPFSAISSGPDFACGINTESYPYSTPLYCWGSNEAGQLGYGGLVSIPLPKRIKMRQENMSLESNVDHVFQSVLSGGKHACAAEENRSNPGSYYLYCWGNNEYGQLGNNESDDFITKPSYPVSGQLFTSYALGRNHTCGVNLKKQIWCWGSNLFAQLGVTAKINHSEVPVQIQNSNQFKSVAITRNSSCGITESNQVFCWGSNNNGQLGIGQIGDKFYTPTMLPISLYYLSSGTGNHICGLSPFGNLYCWGKNDSGQLGIGIASQYPEDTPQLIASEKKFIQVSTGRSHTCALDHNGYAYCWGSNQYGQLGIPKSNVFKPTDPVTVEGKYVTWSNITTGDDFTCGVSHNKSYCWGKNDSGQLGYNSRIDQHTPVWINSY